MCKANSNNDIQCLLYGERQTLSSFLFMLTVQQLLMLRGMTQLMLCTDE